MDPEFEPIKPPKEKKQSAPPAAIALNQDRALAPTNSVELRRVLAMISEGKGFPERFKTEAERIAAYNLANSLLGGKWQLALNNIAVIKGQMSIWGELPSALAEHTGEVQEKEVYCVDKDFKKISIQNKNVNVEPYAGVCLIQRKGRKLKEFYYTVDDAHKAGQLPAVKQEWVNNKRTGNTIPNDDSPWVKHPKTMLMRKAMALAVKFEFADAVMGVPISEWDHDSIPDGSMKDVTPSSAEAADEINNSYGGEQEVNK